MERKYPFCLVVNLFQSTKKLFEPLHLLDQGWPTFFTSGPKYVSNILSGPNFIAKRP